MILVYIIGYLVTGGVVVYLSTVFGLIDPDRQDIAAPDAGLFDAAVVFFAWPAVIAVLVLTSPLWLALRNRPSERARIRRERERAFRELERDALTPSRVD